MRKVQPSDKSAPCVICEKEVKLEWFLNADLNDISSGAFDRGVHCLTSGNYGSQVHDVDGYIHFLICDGCLIRHSNKMVWQERYDSKIISARDHHDEWYEAVSQRALEEDYPVDPVITSYFQIQNPPKVTPTEHELKEQIRHLEDGLTQCRDALNSMAMALDYPGGRMSQELQTIYNQTAEIIKKLLDGR